MGDQTLLARLDESLLDGPGGEAEAPLIYAAVEIERLSPHDPVPSCLRGLAGVLAAERAATPVQPEPCEYVAGEHGARVACMRCGEMPDHACHGSGKHPLPVSED